MWSLIFLLGLSFGVNSKDAYEYGAKCEEDIQCSWLGEYSECNQCKTCSCKENFQWLKGGCRKIDTYNNPCVETCYDEFDISSLTCENSKCTCSKNYYLINGICRKKGTRSSCAMDSDCLFVNKNYKCVVGKCTKHNSEINQVIREFKATSTTSTLDCENECVISNSYCDQKIRKCVCKPGYFLQKYGDQIICTSELYVQNNCSSENECYKFIPGSTCKEKSCHCRDYWFPSEDKRSCIKSMIQTNWNCTSNEWCYALGKNSYCDSGTCTCDNQSKLVGDFCEIQNEPPPECKKDCHCLGVKLSTCLHQSCTCSPLSIKSEHQCTPVQVGAPCDHEVSCDAIANSGCVNNKCVCKKGYKSILDHTNKIKCFKEVKIQEPCIYSEQCVENYNVCDSTTKTCSCQKGYTMNQKYCWKTDIYQKYCTNSLNCTMVLGPTFQCRNSICQCPTYTRKIGNVCSSVRKKNVIFDKVILIFYLFLFIK